MKKILIILLSLLLFILASIYALLFTDPGNKLLQPAIEAKINENSPLKVTLSEFKLGMSSLRVLIRLDEDNAFLIQGNYSLLNQSFDLNYDLKFAKLSNLSTVAKRKLSGELKTAGTLSGDIDLFKIKGQSDLALSKTDYALVIKNMNPDKAAIKLQDADLEKLLKMAGELPYCKGKLDLHIQLNDLDPKLLQGNILFALKEANLNPALLQKEFGLTLNKTALSSSAKATFKEGSIHYLFNLDSELASLASKGKIRINEQTIDTDYKVDIQELALLKSISNAPLRGPFFTQGKIQGDKSNLAVNGMSNIAGSNSSYDLKLHDLKPSKVIVHIKDAHLNKLLYMTGQKSFADAKINADIEFNELSADKLDGKAKLRLSEGKFNQAVMKKEFQITLPQTNFDLQASTLLNPENIGYTLAFNSNLAHLDSSGDIKPKTMQTAAVYTIDIKELGLLKPLTNTPLRGPLRTAGKINGNQEKLSVKGESDLASSKTDYSLVLKDLAPQSLKLNLKDAQLSKLLYLSGEDDYAQGKLNLDADFSSVTPMNAKLNLSLTDGLVHTAVIKNSFDIALPYTKFELKSDAEIIDNKLTSDSKLHSNLADLTMKKTAFDINETSLKSEYLIVIPSLETLEPILERKLHGKLTLDGEIKKNKKLIITAHSDIFGGRFDSTIVDDDFQARFKNLHTVEILKMLTYPQVIDAPLNGTLVYNTKTEKGRLDSRFDQAALTRSQLTELIGKFSKTDLTRERFDEGVLISTIDHEIINSDLQMHSKAVSLKSKKFILNSKKELIDARFALLVKKYPGDVIVTGKINSPKVSLDAKSMLTPEIEKKVGKELNKLLKKLF